jgi:hypothetical protein
MTAWGDARHPTAVLPAHPTAVMPAHPTAVLPAIPTVVMPAQAGIQYSTGARRRNANAGVYWIVRLRGR